MDVILKNIEKMNSKNVSIISGIIATLKKHEEALKIKDGMIIFQWNLQTIGFTKSHLPQLTQYIFLHRKGDKITMSFGDDY